MAEFEVGDLVQLKSGGPVMTIKRVDGTMVACQWFAGKNLEEGRFYPSTLVRAETDEQQTHS